jgi:hypothetical protein
MMVMVCRKYTMSNRKRSFTGSMRRVNGSWFNKPAGPPVKNTPVIVDVTTRGGDGEAVATPKQTATAASNTSTDVVVQRAITEREGKVCVDHGRRKRMID